MRWLWFVGSVICFAVVFRTPSMGLAVVSLIGALGFMLMGVVALASSRIDARSRDATTLLGPDELRRVREAAQRRGDAVPTLAVGGAIVGTPIAAAAMDRPVQRDDHGGTGAVDPQSNAHYRSDSHDDGGSAPAGGDGGSDGGGGGD